MGNLVNYLYKCLISNNLEVPRPHSPIVHEQLPYKYFLLFNFFSTDTNKNCHKESHKNSIRILGSQ